jgi:hypothetical protein
MGVFVVDVVPRRLELGRARPQRVVVATERSKTEVRM